MPVVETMVTKMAYSGEIREAGDVATLVEPYLIADAEKQARKLAGRATVLAVEPGAIKHVHDTYASLMYGYEKWYAIMRSRVVLNRGTLRRVDAEDAGRHR